MKIKIWGARGSLPAPLTPAALESRMMELVEGFLEAGHTQKSEIPKFFSSLPAHRLGGYGGNTPCVEVTAGNHQAIIDAGSGIRMLGYDLMKGPCGSGKGEAHLFFTHFHWDHLIGLPFFTPIFIPGNTIHVYAVQADLKDVFRTLFRKPYFPLDLEQIGARIVYHALDPRKPFGFGEMTITPYQLDHPDPCWGYKIEHAGRAYSHCVDTEATRTSHEELGPDLPLYQGVDLMIFDAQYTLIETIEKVNWGHAAAPVGLDIAMREGVKKVVFMHHDPASTDEKIAAAEAQARRYYETQLRSAKRTGVDSGIREIDWIYAREGMFFEL